MIINIDKKAEEIGLKSNFVKMLFDSFFDESAIILKDLQDATLKKDFKVIENKLHSLKGSCGNLQLNEIYELAKLIELAAKAKRENFNYASSVDELSKMFKGLEVAQ